MQAKVKKWGNSQGVIIPKEVLKEACIKLDDLLNIKVAKGSITLSVPFRHRTLEERMAETDGKMVVSHDIDLGEPEGRELL